MLWTYVAACAVFLVVVTFSESHNFPGSGRWGPIAKAIFIVFGMASAFIAVSYATSGQLFVKRVNGRMKRKRASVGRRTWTGDAVVADYEESVLWYCDRVLIGAVLASLLAGALGMYMWFGNDFRAVQLQATPVKIVPK